MKNVLAAAMMVLAAAAHAQTDAGIVPAVITLTPAAPAASLATVSGTATDPAPIAAASSGDSLSDLAKWLGTQQAQLGTSMGFSKVKYIVTYWDASSWGQSGINIGKAGALDYIDLSLGMAAANGEATRYGFFLPVHVGNIVNSSASWMPSAISNHVHLTTLPNTTIALVMLYPRNGVLKSWTIKKDGQLSVSYRFGGTN